MFQQGALYYFQFLNCLLLQQIFISFSEIKKSLKKCLMKTSETFFCGQIVKKLKIEMKHLDVFPLHLYFVEPYVDEEKDLIL